MKFQYTVILTSSLDDKVELLNIGVKAVDKGNALKQVIRRYPDEIEKCGNIMIYEDMEDSNN